MTFKKLSFAWLLTIISVAITTSAYAVETSISDKKKVENYRPELLASNHRFQVWAAPMTYGPWSKVGSHIGSVYFKIKVAPIGSTKVVGEIRYYDENNKKRVVKFNDQISIKTGNSVSNIEVRLKGVPTGSSCWVTVN